MNYKITENDFITSILCGLSGLFIIIFIPIIYFNSWNMFYGFFGIAPFMWGFLHTLHLKEYLQNSEEEK